MVSGTVAKRGGAWQQKKGYRTRQWTELERAERDHRLVSVKPQVNGLPLGKAIAADDTNHDVPCLAAQSTPLGHR